MKQLQSRDLITFLSALHVENTGVVRWNSLDDEIPEISRWYTPHFEVSDIAVRFKRILDTGEAIMPTSSKNLSEGLQGFVRSSYKYTNRYLYALVQSIYLESMAILYTLENDGSLAQYLDKGDAERIHTNIQYVLDALAGQQQHRQLVKDLRLMDVDIMYILSRIGGEYGAIR